MTEVIFINHPGKFRGHFPKSINSNTTFVYPKEIRETFVDLCVKHGVLDMVKFETQAPGVERATIL